MDDEFGICPFCDSTIHAETACHLYDYETNVLNWRRGLESAKDALVAITHLEDSGEAGVIAETILEELEDDAD